MSSFTRRNFPGAVPAGAVKRITCTARRASPFDGFYVMVGRGPRPRDAVIFSSPGMLLRRTGAGPPYRFFHMEMPWPADPIICMRIENHPSSPPGDLSHSGNPSATVQSPAFLLDPV